MKNRPGGSRNRRLTWLVAAAAMALMPISQILSGPPGEGPPINPQSLVRALGTLRPDYARYILSVRQLAPGSGHRLYMALVRPGATNPAGRGSTPFIGAGARNDIVYDPEAVLSGHSVAWRSLLLDHEYFHARHMAGATLLPLARGEATDVERHYNEAAAWGFNVAEARAGRYPGLREDEFREALDRLSEHYRALRDLIKDSDPERWTSISELLSRPDALLMKAGPRPAGDPWRPSGPGQSAATP